MTKSIVPKESRVCLHVNNIAKRLLTIIERQSGDLIVKMRSAPNYRTMGLHSQSEDPIITNQKYSVHSSPNSKSGINALVHTLEMKGQEPVRTSHYTRAIKTGCRFAPLFSARTTTLLPDTYDVRSDAPDVKSLGRFNPSMGSFYYMVAVSGRNSALQIPDAPDVQVRVMQFGLFKLWILSSYAFLPANYAGARTHYLTLPDEQSTTVVTVRPSFADGFTHEELTSQFRVTRQVHLDELVHLVVTDHPDKEAQVRSLAALGFTRSQHTNAA